MPARKQTPEAPAPIYQLKVTLKGANPPIWRRILVAGDTKLSRLHDVLQAAMAWEGYHLHEFWMGREVRIGTPDPEWDAEAFDLDDINGRLASLGKG